MGFKKLRYNNGDGFAKIRLEEESGAIIENWTIHMSDLGSWFRKMKNKYGKMVDKEEKDKDLDWLK